METAYWLQEPLPVEAAAASNPLCVVGSATSDDSCVMDSGPESSDALCSKQVTCYDSASTSLETCDSPRSTPRGDVGVEALSSAPVSAVIAAAAAVTWSRCYTDDGYEYYVNDASGESVWTLPEGAQVAAEAVGVTQSVAPLPLLRWDSYGRPFYYYEATGHWNYANESDWCVEFDETTGCQYFYNTVTCESSWSHPMYPVVPQITRASQSSSYEEYTAPGEDGWRPAARAQASEQSGVTTKAELWARLYGAVSDDDSDASSQGSDSDDSDSSEDEEELMEELARLDGAVVGLTLKQRAAVVRRASGRVLSKISTTASRT